MLPDFLADVSVTTASVQTGLGGATASGLLWQAAPGRFQLEVPDIARYLVEDGRALTIEPLSGVNAHTVGFFARMTPLAALLYQRGIFAFHAAAVANEQGAVLLAGTSGAGKSTLLTALLRRGWTMLSDELAIVELNKRGQVTVQPTSPEIALWPDTIEKLGIDSDQLLRGDANRLVYARPDKFVTGAHPLRSIYWLSVHGKADIEIVKLEGAQRFSAIGTFLYNTQIADALLDRVAYMRCASSIVQSVSICRLRRPRGKWCVEEITDMITA